MERGFVPALFLVGEFAKFWENDTLSIIMEKNVLTYLDNGSKIHIEVGNKKKL
jgi:hypothetical protein